MASTTSSRGTPTAADIMTASPRTCSTFSTVLEAVMIFRDADCGAVPILENAQPVGILTDRDVALALAVFPDLATRTVGEIMTKGLISVPPEATLDMIRQKFEANAVRRLVVIGPNNRLDGIIAWADFARHVSDADVGEVVAENVEQPS